MTAGPVFSPGFLFLQIHLLSSAAAVLLHLKHAFRLSDEAVVARWVENRYYQHSTGETLFQHKLPIDPSSLIRRP